MIPAFFRPCKVFFLLPLTKYIRYKAYKSHRKTDKFFGIQYIKPGEFVFNKQYDTHKSYCSVIVHDKPEIDLLEKMNIPFTSSLQDIIIFLQTNGAKNIILFDHSCSTIEIKSPRQTALSKKVINDPYNLREKMKIRELTCMRSIRRISYNIEKEMKLKYI